MNRSEKWGQNIQAVAYNGAHMVSFSRERKSEMNLKHKIWTYVIHKISQGHITFFEEVSIDSRKHAQDSLKTQKQRNKYIVKKKY